MRQWKKFGIELAGPGHTMTFKCTDCNGDVIRLDDDEVKKTGKEPGNVPWWKCLNPECPQHEPFQEPMHLKRFKAK